MNRKKKLNIMSFTELNVNRNGGANQISPSEIILVAIELYMK